MSNGNAEPFQYPIERLLRPEDVASILNVSRSYAYTLLQTGELPAVRLGRSVRVRPQDLENYISTNVSTGSQAMRSNK